MIGGWLALVSHLSLHFIAAIFGLLWKQLSYGESSLPSRQHGVSRLLFGERMLLVTLIKAKWFHKSIRWSSTSRAIRGPWGERLRTAIRQRKTPSPNLLLILITIGELRLCLQRFLSDAGRGYDNPQGSRCCSHILKVSSEYRNWVRRLLFSESFAAGASVRAEPLEVWAESFHAANYSSLPWW